MTVSGFDTRLEAVREWQPSPWRRLRHASADANLLRHLDPAPQRVLDVAGGGGSDAVWLAARGHDVTLLDPAGAMLRNATEHAEALGVADCLHVVQATAEDAPVLFGTDAFDAVLCHNLLQYAEDRAALLAAITAPLRPGGVLSVLAPNAESTHPCPVVTPSCHAAEVVGDLTALGFGLVLRYGVGCVFDETPDDEVDDALLAELRRLELAMADRMPHVLTAQFFHLVALR